MVSVHRLLSVVGGVVVWFVAAAMRCTAESDWGGIGKQGVVGSRIRSSAFAGFHTVMRRQLASAFTADGGHNAAEVSLIFTAPKTREIRREKRPGGVPFGTTVIGWDPPMGRRSIPKPHCFEMGCGEIEVAIGSRPGLNRQPIDCQSTTLPLSYDDCLAADAHEEWRSQS